MAEPDKTLPKFMVQTVSPCCLSGKAYEDARPAASNMSLRRAYEQFRAKPHFSDLAEDALLVRAAEERIVGPKNPYQHVLRFTAALLFPAIPEDVPQRGGACP